MTVFIKTGEKRCHNGHWVAESDQANPVFYPWSLYPHSVAAHIYPSRLRGKKVLDDAGVRDAADLNGEVDMVCHQTR